MITLKRNEKFYKRNLYALEAIGRSGSGYHSGKRYGKRDRNTAKQEIDEAISEHEEENGEQVRER